MEDRLIDFIVELLARSVHEGYQKLIDKGFKHLSVILKLNAVIVWPFFNWILPAGKGIGWEDTKAFYYRCGGLLI